MPARRPVGITVFAILNLVFGGLGLLCNACGLGSVALQGQMEQLQMEAQKGGPKPFDTGGLQTHLEAKAPGYVLFQWLNPLFGLLLALLLVLGGLALLGMKPSARMLCITYSVLAIAFTLGSFAYNVIYVTPAVDEWLKAQQGPQLPSGVFTAGAVFGLVIGMAYAVALLIFMLLPSTAAALSGRLSPTLSPDSGQPEDYYDDDFERRRRDEPPNL